MVAGGLIVGNQAVEESKDPRKDLETLEQRAATADLVARLGGVLLGGTAVVVFQSARYDGRTLIYISALWNRLGFHERFQGRLI